MSRRASSRDEYPLKKFLQIAYDVAATSKCRQKHGAVVIKRGQVRSVAANQRRGLVTDAYPHTIHAEELALLRAGSTSAGATLLVARVNRAGELRLSAPCRRCQGAIERAGIRRVIYTT